MYSRRDLVMIALGALPAAQLLAKPNSVVRGVLIGVQSYSFRDRPFKDALKAMTDIGLSYCELWEGHIAPASLSRNGLREWRETIAIEQFQVVREDCTKAGVNIQAYNYDIQSDFSDKEIDRGFEMAKALGAQAITTSSPTDMAPRINAFALKHDMTVGMQNAARADNGAFAKPNDFERVMKATSKIGLSLDTANMAATGSDPMLYLQEHSGWIKSMYIRDRRKDGVVLPLGQGDIALAEILRIVALNKLRIPVMIKYDYEGGNPADAVAQAYEYCRIALKAK